MKIQENKNIEVIIRTLLQNLQDGYMQEAHEAVHHIHTSSKE